MANWAWGKSIAMLNSVLLFLSVLVETAIPGTNIGASRMTTAINLPSKPVLENVVVNPLPVSGGEAHPVLAMSGMVLDNDTGTVLVKKNIDKKVKIASITKLVTALVIIDAHKLDEVVTVPEFKLKPLETSMGLKKGDKVKVGELLHGLLIPSGSDAATALAVYHSGSVPKFVQQMNNKTSEWGMKNSNFVNPTGIDEGGEYSTASDVALLGRLALTNETIRSIVAKKRYTARSEKGKKYSLLTTNTILDGKFIVGIKTGFTNLAGQCLLSYAKKDGHEIISIVLNSPDRFGESYGHLHWAFRNFTY